MDSSRFACAIWPWGTEKREQMEQAAREVTEVGYQCFESVKAAIYAYDLDLDAYKEVLKRYSLKPVSFYFHLPEWEKIEDFFSTVKRELGFVAALDVKVLSLQGSPFRPEKEDRESKERELEAVMRFARLSEEAGIRTCVHPHHNTWIMKEDEIDYIMQNTSAKEVSFCPDTAHLIAGECNHVEVIRRYADRVGFTHLKDFAMGDHISSSGFASAGMEVYTNFAELGKGDVNFKEVFKILDEVGYKGYYCAELDRAPISNVESAKNNFAFLKNFQA